MCFRFFVLPGFFGYRYDSIVVDEKWGVGKELFVYFIDQSYYPYKIL